MSFTADDAEISNYESDGVLNASGVQTTHRGQLVLVDECENLLLRLKCPKTGSYLTDIRIYKETESSQLGRGSYIIANHKDDSCGWQIKISDGDKILKLAKLIKSFKLGVCKAESKFSERTDSASEQQYFQFYG